MNALSKASPVKRKQAQESTSNVKPRPLLSLGVEGWPCPDRDNCRGGLLRIVKKKDGGEFLTCDQNEWKNPGSCKVSLLSLLKASKDHPHLCTLCLQDVGGKPSLGTSTGKTDSRGYTVWENVHGVFSHCAGAKTSDGTRFKNATSATSEHIGKSCHCHDPESSPCVDLKDGCTGIIIEGDLLVKDWDDPPLHLQCAKRAWKQTVKDILRQKNQLRELNSTADKEAKQPSAAVPADLQDF